MRIGKFESKIFFLFLLWSNHNHNNNKKNEILGKRETRTGMIPTPPCSIMSPQRVDKNLFFRSTYYTESLQKLLNIGMR